MEAELDFEKAMVGALNEMYDEAEPPLDFDDVLDNPDDYGDDWYRQHELDADRQTVIADKYIEKYDLSKQEQSAFHMRVLLDLAPKNA